MRFFYGDSRRQALLAAMAIPVLSFMVCWVFVFPASYWTGWWLSQDARLANLGALPYISVPLDVFTKYRGNPAVKFTHLLPSGIWALCGALQLLPRLRRTAPRLHRLSGRVMLACAASMAIGYLIMEARYMVLDEAWSQHMVPPAAAVAAAAVPGYVGTTNDSNNRENASFKPQGGGLHEGDGIGAAMATIIGTIANTSASGNIHVAGIARNRPMGLLLLRLVTCWFITTAYLAFKHARARRFQWHADWAVRHVASGGWVIVQRLLIILLASAARAAGVVWSDRQRQELFIVLEQVSMAACIAGAEVLLQRRQWSK
ncbi:hypothetical protein Agub_g8699, partial [Astrephomene gubernaculifera]